MRVVVIIGSHPRHLHIAKELAKSNQLVGIIMQKREPMLVEEEVNLPKDIAKLNKHHFELRLMMEEKYFGLNLDKNLINNYPYLLIEKEELNSLQVENFIKTIKADVLISYGPNLIKDNILSLCPDHCFNIHGGLSPWYKGAATMFWPFYFLEPNYVGTTIHHISSKIDAGNIIHQVVPELEYGNCMHEVACKAIEKTGKELSMLVSVMEHSELLGLQQKKTGKLFLERDWRPDHLRLIYELYNDKIVDLYLDGSIQKSENPKLIKAW